MCVAHDVVITPQLVSVFAHPNVWMHCTNDGDYKMTHKILSSRRIATAAVAAGALAISGLIAVQPSRAADGLHTTRSASTDFSAAKKKHVSRNNPKAAYGSISGSPMSGGGQVYSSPGYSGYSGGYGYGYGDNSRNQTW
jgi:hypothetical protein